MAPLQWLCLVAVLFLCPSPAANMEVKTQALEPLRHVPEIVFSYPFMMKRYPGLFDFILSLGTEYVFANDYDRVKVPNVEKSVTITVKGISYSTTFTGSNGWMENLSTLTRVDDVKVTQYRTGSVSMGTVVSFRSLTIGFNQYVIPVGLLIKLKGQIKIKANVNRIGMKVLIVAHKEANNCTFSLEELKIHNLGDFRATVTGLYPFNWILSIIVNLVVEDNRSVVRAFIEGKFSLEARYFIMMLPCGHT